jgi:hypothetical protein
MSLGFPAQFKYDDRVRNEETQSADHEAAVIRAFVQRDKQERFLGFLASPKNRKKFTESLSHFRWFDQRFAAPLQWKVDQDPKLTHWEKHLSGIGSSASLRSNSRPSLPVGLAIGIKAVMFTALPSGFQFRLANVPVRTAFLQHSTQVLP